jgi:CRISPR/Cas system CMR-associated protein Cmr1 (group 7 of RAMP superfamily)
VKFSQTACTLGDWINCQSYVMQFLVKHKKYFTTEAVNPLTPNGLKRRRAASPLKIKIPGKNMREKPINTPIIHSVY